MRKGFDGLSGIVRNEMELDPMNGAVYIFFNKPRNLVKLLLWDTTGFAIYHKRLSKGSFGEFISRDETKDVAQIRRDELLCILEGIELDSIQRRRRYTLKT
jgi:hypothetical protein